MSKSSPALASSLRPAPTPSPAASIHLHDLLHLRQTLPPPDFRLALRRYLLDHPQVRLQRVASELGVSRQKVGWLAGRLNRETCCLAGPRQALEREKAAALLPRLRERVAAGEPAAKVARELGLSMSTVAALGFRVRAIRPAHGTWDRARKGCNCWRCRAVAGLTVPRGPRIPVEQVAEVVDWLAWVDPDTGERLRQVEIGRLVGVGQSAVSRVATGLWLYRRQ